MNSDNLKEKMINIDKQLSKRDIELDPKGYFIIKLDQINKKIIVEHYLNNINKKGIALDPITNKPIECDSSNTRKYNKIFNAETAKKMGILLTEEKNILISKFDHALYLGRELQKAEECLLNNSIYIQD